MSCLSLIEATKKLKSNLVMFLGVGAFEPLFGPVRGKLNKNFPNIQMPRRGGGGGGRC